MTQIIPLSSCQRGEFIFNKKGLIVGSPLSHEYYKIYCLLMNKGPKIIEIYYPFLFFSSPQQLMDIIKILTNTKIMAQSSPPLVQFEIIRKE